MEFNEKLKSIRKSKGITQEELAEALFVSRTAVSKWESGKGYPGIDSLKAISSYFEVTVDELLSGEKILSIAEKENKANILSVLDTLFAFTDVCSLLLVVLPLYPNSVEGYIYSVNLLLYSQVSKINMIIYWAVFVLLTFLGIAEVILAKLKVKKCAKLFSVVSVSISFFGVVFLALAREAYATVVLALLLLIKGLLLVKRIKTEA